MCISESAMNFPHSPPRFYQFASTGCVLIAFFSGMACSSAVERGQKSPDRGAPKVELEPETGDNGLQDDLKVGESHPAEPRGDIHTERHQDEQRGVLAIEPDSDRDKIIARNKELMSEMLSLYRRLHIELDDAGRSALIVELLGDPRIEFQNLGFELVDRDLSSSTVLDPLVGEWAKRMLDDPNAQIRSKAARLITRLVPPDAMLVLTASLAKEQDPIAAEPMLLGVARWPSPEATGPVLRWFLRSDSPFEAACSAAWALELNGLWNPDLQHPILLDRLRKTDPTTLHEAGMKLISRFGDASDLHVLVTLLLSENPDQQKWAANALVETPRAVEVLVQAAEENKLLFIPASDSLIRHRATPDGLRRLVSLPYPDEQIRTAKIELMGLALDVDRLAAAVQLADLDATLSTLLLNRLLSSEIQITPQVANGVIRLAEIELEEQRPNRALEAAIALDEVSLDPIQLANISQTKTQSLILLGRMDDALLVNQDPLLWLLAIDRTQDPELRDKIAAFVLDNLTDALSDEQRSHLNEMIKPDDTPDQPATTQEDGD
jgi:hypothetical protein